MKIFITGGCGFIGSHLVDYLISETNHSICNLDALTYASQSRWAKQHVLHPQYQFIHGDVLDDALLKRIFTDFKPDAVMHLAAQTHVDRSINNPSTFTQTNLIGTERLLEACLSYWRDLPEAERSSFRYLQVSTDEVYGDLSNTDALATEDFAYRPSSPYSASKAAADHLVRAWQRTYELPSIITCCSNNYGPYQHNEKLIPHLLREALHGRPLPIYGDGEQIRDWMHVQDHVRGLYLVLTLGQVGETYNIGANNLLTNNELVAMLCDLLDERAGDLHQPLGISTFHQLITYVDDRAGHDRRYAVDSRKIQETLGWTPQIAFADGLMKTVDHYLYGDEAHD